MTPTRDQAQAIAEFLTLSDEIAATGATSGSPLGRRRAVLRNDLADLGVTTEMIAANSHLRVRAPEAVDQGAIG